MSGNDKDLIRLITMVLIVALLPFFMVLVLRGI